MNPVRPIRRLAAALAGLAGALLAFAAASPAALAMTPADPVPHPVPGVPEPYPGANLPAAPVPAQIHTVTRTVVIGGMPGWQIALIAAGAALLAAAVAVLAYRALATRRKTVTAAA